MGSGNGLVSSHNLNQCWRNSMSPNNISMPQWGQYAHGFELFGLYYLWWSSFQVHVAFCPYSSSWWRHQMETFLRYWPFVKGIHRWCGVWCVSLICTWTNGWANKRRCYATPSRSLWRHCNDGCSTGIETNVYGCPKPVKWLWNLWVNWPAPNHNKTQQGATIWMSFGTLYMHFRKWVWNGRPTYCVLMLSHILFTWLRFLGVGWDFSSIT